MADTLPMPDEGEDDQTFLMRFMLDPDVTALFPDDVVRLAVGQGQISKARDGHEIQGESVQADLHFPATVRFSQ
jgi:hypothetical protein